MPGTSKMPQNRPRSSRSRSDDTPRDPPVAAALSSNRPGSEIAPASRRGPARHGPSASRASRRPRTVRMTAQEGTSPLEVPGPPTPAAIQTNRRAQGPTPQAGCGPRRPPPFRRLPAVPRRSPSKSIPPSPPDRTATGSRTHARSGTTCTTAGSGRRRGHAPQCPVKDETAPSLRVRPGVCYYMALL